MSIPAQYEGRCPCGEPITLGQLIVSVDDQWVHEDCEGLALAPKDPPLCSECFIFHVGECA